jgi:hypothetical protein
MLYLAGAFVALAVALGTFDLLRLTPGAGGVANVMLVAALICLCIKGVSSWHHSWREHHPLPPR